MSGMLQVKADKLREVKNGHDGTWVAHPALVTLALEIFNEYMPQPNQIDKKREDVHVTRENLLEVLHACSIESSRPKYVSHRAWVYRLAQPQTGGS